MQQTYNRREFLDQTLGASMSLCGFTLMLTGCSKVASPNRQFPASFKPGLMKYADNVRPISSASGVNGGGYVHIGGGVCLSASHSPIDQDAISYLEPTLTLEERKLKLDLRFLQFDPNRMPDSLGISSVPIASELPAPGSQIVHSGFGRERAVTARFAPGKFHGLCRDGKFCPVIRDAVNSKYAPLFEIQSIPFEDGTLTYFSRGDSGGGVFAYHEAKQAWELIGIILAISTVRDRPSTSPVTTEPSKTLKRNTYAVALNLCDPDIKIILADYFRRFYGSALGQI